MNKFVRINYCCGISGIFIGLVFNAGFMTRLISFMSLSYLKFKCYNKA